MAENTYMRIIDDTTKKPNVTYADIKIGQCFKRPSRGDDYVFMKINVNGEDKTWDFKYNQLTHTDYDAECIPLDYDLHIVP